MRWKTRSRRPYLDNVAAAARDLARVHAAAVELDFMQPLVASR
jgi:hypothetical protein